MKKTALFALSALFLSPSAFAYLPSAAITTLALPMYGIYTSADPTCLTGMTATVALSTTPQQLNFAAGTAIGSGPLPATIGCVVIVIGNNLSNAWSAGTYTSTTSANGGTAYSDSACNAGGTTSGQSICGGGSTISVRWPQKIIDDAQAIGLTLTTTTCHGLTSEIVPLVLSTNSICTGQGVADAATPACAGGNIDNFTLPLSTADANHGTKLVAPSVAGNLKFVVNPENTLGATGATGCDNIKAPLFSFAAI